MEEAEGEIRHRPGAREMDRERPRPRHYHPRGRMGGWTTYGQPARHRGLWGHGRQEGDDQEEIVEVLQSLLSSVIEEQYRVEKRVEQKLRDLKSLKDSVQANRRSPNFGMWKLYRLARFYAPRVGQMIYRFCAVISVLYLLSHLSGVTATELPLDATSIGVSELDREFRAYDCSAPINLTAMVASPVRDCKTEAVEVETTKKTYRVLQEARYTKMKLKRCRATVSRMVGQCGAAASYQGLAHWLYTQINMDADWRFNEEYWLTLGQCQTLWDGKFRDPMHLEREYRINVPGRTKVILNTAGTNHYVTEKNRRKGYVMCEGNQKDEDPWVRQGPLHHGRKYHRLKDPTSFMDKMIVTDHIQFRLEEVEAIRSADGEITLTRDRLVLPCRVGDTFCQVEGEGTFYWRPPTEDGKCHFFSALEEPVEGMEIVDAHGLTNFYDEKTMLRLERRGSVSRCGSVVHRTDFKNIFLTEDLEAPLMKRPIDPSEVSIITYANQQDKFLYSEVVDTIRNELEQLRKQQCLRDRGRMRGEYARQAAEQQALMDGETAMVAPGHFVTASGEIWYAYHCKPLVVKAVPKSECFSALPVELSSADFQLYLRNRGASGEEPEDMATADEFYLEPKTHRLVTATTPVDCAPPLVPLYKNRHGKWLAWDGPTLYPAQPPISMDDAQWDFDGEVEVGKQFNYEDGGLYSANTVRKMEKLRIAPQAIRGLMAVLHLQDKKQRVSAPRSAHDLFSDVPEVNVSSLGLWKRFWSFVETYGLICSIVVGTGLILRFVTWVAGVLFRLFAAPVTGSILFHIASAFFPSARDFLRDRWLVGAARKEAKKEENIYVTPLQSLNASAPPAQEL